MLSEEQILYLEEVLGTSADHYRRAATTVAPSITPEVVVLTPPLGDEERGLLAKILGSVQLTGYLHVEDPGLLPMGAQHILSFEENYGRRLEAGVTWWGLPALNEMLGAGPAVSAVKKSAWSLLQQFAKERA